MVKKTPFDSLRNEIASEKFAALRRISERLSQTLNDLEILECRINQAVAEGALPAELNKTIKVFNELREEAIEWRQYLIVTRESSGFFSSVLQTDAYKIPPQKKLADVR